MKDRREEVRRIEEALVSHHRGSTPAEVPPFLAQKTVMRLREEWVSREAAHLNGMRVRGLVWRFTLVTCLLAVLLGAFGMRTDIQTQYQYAEFMLDDESEIEWAQDFGVL